MSALTAIAEELKQGNVPSSSDEDVRIYSRSFLDFGILKLIMVKEGVDKYIMAVGKGTFYDDLQGEETDTYKKCPLSHENRLVLNKHLDFTVPHAFGTEVATFGLGDRLGIASPGHIEVIRDREIKPILAQQSIRELNLTGRNYKEVIDAACFAAFQEGYKDGFGADGDHLKTEEEVQMALDLGFSMLTLDCSDHIDNSIEGSDAATIEQKYSALDESVRKHYESNYLDQSFQIGETTIRFDRQSLMKNVLIYGAAIDYMKHIYTKFIQPLDRPLDFEISIDETATPTEPEAHYFVANELYADSVHIFSMAPRFCGEFQKGIDYIGDIEQFENELIVHAAIADHFGFKLSIHSGSDKFSVFPIIGKHTNGRFHAKTAGTNWLEAVRTVAKVKPDLYRRMHQYAMDNKEEALKYYVVTTDFDAIKPLDTVPDDELPAYMDDDNARQLIHITFGVLLSATDENGHSLFKDEFMQTLADQEDAYRESLITHIGKHLELLGK